MKNLFAVLILSQTFAISSITFCQQDPILVGDVYSPIWNNPASYGTWNKFSINTIFQNGPKYVIPGRTTFFANGEYKFDYKKTNLKSGIGVNYYSYAYGYTHENDVSLNCNIQTKIRKVSLSLGISPGVQTINYVNICWPPFDSAAAQINQPLQTAGTRFNMGAGFMVYAEKFYFGISSRNVLFSQNEKMFNGITKFYNINTGYRFNITPKFVAFPSAQFTMADGFYNLSGLFLLNYKPLGIKAGLGYGSSSSLIATIGYDLKNFSVSYFFTNQKSLLTNTIRNVHEFRLSYRIPYEFTPKTKSICHLLYDF